MDFKTRQPGDVFKLLSLYWNKSFSEVLEIISKDINANHFEDIELHKNRIKPKKC